MTDKLKEPVRYETAKLLASYLLSLSLFALAGSFVYFTIEMSAVTRQIPDILVSINNTSEKIGPLVNEVGEIIELVPPILKEVEETRKLIPPILKEVEQTRKQIPSVLKESEAIRKELPAVLASADKASDAVVVISKEIEATRPLVPKVLKEIETTRESIPPMMDRADALIQKARVAGKEASEGAVTGAITGIIKAPFRLVGGAGKAIIGIDKEEQPEGFNDDDYEMIEKTSLNLLNNGLIGDSQKWSNTDTDNSGTITLIKTYIDEGVFSDTECRELNVKLFTGDKEVKDTNRKVCKDGEKWEIIE